MTVHGNISNSDDAHEEPREFSTPSWGFQEDEKEKEEENESALENCDVHFLPTDNAGRAGNFEFEDLLQKVGTAGKYQFIQCALCLSTMQLLVFMGLGFVFIGYTPEHVCQTVNETELLQRHDLLNDSSVKLIYGQCDVTVTSNRTGNVSEVLSLSCPDGRHFPGGHGMTLVSEWDLVCERKGQAELAQLMYGIGNILGGLIGPGLADRLGRKPVLIAGMTLNTIIEFSIAFAPNMYFVCGALLVDGISYVAIGSVYLVLGMEILVPRHRQILGIVACQLWVTCTLITGLVGYLLQDTGWRYFQAVGALSGFLSIGLPFFLDESPRWLAINGRSEEALKILEKACRQNGTNFPEVRNAFKMYMNSVITFQEQAKESVQNGDNPKNEMADLKMLENEYSGRRIQSKCAKDFKRQEDANKGMDTTVNKYTILDMLTRKDTLILLVAVWFIWCTCNLTYYGLFMSSSDMPGDRFLNFCLIAVVDVPANFLILYLMNRMGRLGVLRIFLSLAALSILTAAFLSHFKEIIPRSDISSVALIIIGKFAITAVFNTIYVCTPEIFPTVLRASGTGSCKSVPKVGSMLAPYSRPLYSIAKWAPGLIFSVFCFIAFLLTFPLPETKDKNLPTRLTDVDKNKNKNKRLAINGVGKN